MTESLRIGWDELYPVYYLAPDTHDWDAAETVAVDPAMTIRWRVTLQLFRDVQDEMRAAVMAAYPGKYELSRAKPWFPWDEDDS